MNPMITRISPDGFSCWDEFTKFTPDDPYDEWGTFTLNVGLEPSDPGEVWHVCVATVAAVSRKKQEGSRRFKGLVVSRFDSDLVKQSIDEYVSQITAISWSDIQRHLNKVMV